MPIITEFVLYFWSFSRLERMVSELVNYVFRVFVSIIGGTPDKHNSEGLF